MIISGLNLYTVWNGDYYTEVLVIAKDCDEAIGLATPVYIADARDCERLRCDLIIEDIKGPVASDIKEA